jgi:hypothetical protein
LGYGGLRQLRYAEGGVLVVHELNPCWMYEKAQGKKSI